MTPLRILMVGVCCIISTLPTMAQHAVFSAASFVTPSKQAAPKSLASTPFAATQVLNFNAAQAEHIFMKTTASSITLRDFPVEKNKYETVELVRSRPVIDGTTRISRVTKNGMVPVAIPAMINYHGTISGDAKSRINVVYAGGEMYAAIYRGDGTQTQIVPSTETTAKGSHLMTVINDAGMQPFRCYADEIPEYYTGGNAYDSKYANKTQALDTTLKEATIALETDRFVWSKLGKNETRLINYVNAIFATVSNKYEDEINVTLHIGDMLIHTDDDPDPYPENSNPNKDIGVLLDQVRDFWNNNYASIPRDFVHVLSGPGTTNVGGIAYREQLCSNGLGYGVSGIHCIYTLPMLTYVWDSFVVTHEIGHTFSARHTHDCWWNPALDTCITQNDSKDVCYNLPRRKNPGSIMSYCHLYYPPPRYTFTEKVADTIKNYAHTRKCLTVPTPGAVRIIFPLGGTDQSYRSDTTLTVRWTSAKVNTVNVEYSIDGGKGWTPIAQGIAAAPGNTPWKLPEGTNSNQCLVRIYNTENPLMGDTSYVVFSMKAVSITMVNPTGGERIARKSTETITWNASGVSKFNVEFSATGDAPWTTLTSNTTSKSYSWTVPDIESSTAKVRVLDATNNNLIAISNTFAIGTPFISLVKPVGSEELCVSTSFNINWQSDFVKTVNVSLSTDGGATYPVGQRLASNLNAPNGQLTWIPRYTQVSTNARIRVSNTADGSIVAESPASFTVKLCATSGVNDVSAEEQGLAIRTIAPTSSAQQINVQLYNGGNAETVECSIIAADGRTQAESNRLMLAGENTMEFNTEALAQGQYILRLRANGRQCSAPFVIVR